MISVSGLSKSFGARVLFQGVSFQAQAGERIGVVGANGSGKSTLIKILGGDMEPSGGEVSIAKGIRLGVLRQNRFSLRDERIVDAAQMGNTRLWSAMREMEELIRQAESHFDEERYGTLEETVRRYDGYAAEARARAVLAGLGIPTRQHERPVSSLSGGFRLRVLLAQVLCGDPDALLLDEPTNFLDIVAIRWLEQFLKSFPGPALVVTHDHRFLDRVATRILDVDYQTAASHPGNYSAFLEKTKEERERRRRELMGRERELARHQRFVDRFRAKASKARQAQSKARLIRKRESELKAPPISSRRSPALSFVQERPSGRDVLRAKGIHMAYGDRRVLVDVTLEARRGDRLAVIGPNGAGKSTLLKILSGELEADEGEVHWGGGTRVGYFAQDVASGMRERGESVLEWVRGFPEGRESRRVRGMLGRVFFSGDDAHKPLRDLSGGEAARLALCRLMLQEPNVLVLDEPTNHLDLESIRALAGALGRYEGTLILVSHDRWFVSELATRILEVALEGVTHYPGGYEDYLAAQGADHLGAGAASTETRRKRKARGARAKPRRRRVSRPRTAMRELRAKREAVMEEIEGAELKLARVDAALSDQRTYQTEDPFRVRDLQTKRQTLQRRVDRLMGDWEELEVKIAASGESSEGAARARRP